MENITTLARLRVEINYSQDMKGWLSNFSDTDANFASDEGYFLLEEIVEPLEKIIDDVVGTAIRKYFLQLGVPQENLPVIQHTKTYKGSLIMEVVVVMTTGLVATYTALKAVSELPQIADGLTDLKGRILKKLKPKFNHKVSTAAYQIAKDTFKQTNRAISQPPKSPIKINLVIDTKPLLDIASQEVSKEERLRKRGFLDAGDHKANPSSLQTCLAGVYRDYLNEAQSRKKEVENKIKELQQENLSSQGKIDEGDKEITSKNELIQNLKEDLRKIDSNPEDFKIESEFSPLGFSVGLVLLVFLTFYLLIFYSSAIYSAFFKNLGDAIAQANPNDLSTLFNTIFDPKALQEARASGSLGLVFTILAPFLFLATGFVLFALSRKKQLSPAKKNIRIAAIIFFVFLADVAIAYKITQEIYEAKFIIGVVDREWEPSMIFNDVNFYLVLVAGFAAYIIWSILLDYVVEEYDNSQPIIAAKRNRLKRIEELKQDIEKIDADNKKFQNEIESNQDEIDKLKKSGIINWEDLSTDLDMYMKGWYQYIENISSNKNDPEVIEKRHGAQIELKRFQELKREQLKIG